MSLLSRMRKRNKMVWNIKKYYQWFKLYKKRVRLTEAEIGGELQAC